MLLPDPVFRQTIGVSRRFTVIADDKVFIAFLYTTQCHFFNRVRSVAPVTMTMYNAADVPRLNDVGILSLLRVVNDSSTFPEKWGYFRDALPAEYFRF